MKKRANFIKLAEARVNKALNAIRVVGNLSNKNSYEYTPEDVTKMQEIMTKELERVFGLFNQKPVGGGRFCFDVPKLEPEVVNIHRSKKKR